MILSDKDIRELCVDPEGRPLARPMITPFCERSPGGVLSYGLSSAGYDIRLADEVRLFRDSRGQVIDPKAFRSRGYEDAVFETLRPEGRAVVLPAGPSYILARSLEYFRVPRHLVGTCVGKSTLCRCGVVVNVSPLESEWEGHLTVEIQNGSPAPVRLPLGEGVAQILFHVLSSLPERSYKDKGGVYQGQVGVTPPRVREVSDA